MKSQVRTQFAFPRIRRVCLDSFSLYSQRPNVDLVVKPGVLCLAGANGIGKSTFLAAVNFALTGRIPTPQRGYKSTSEYYEGSARFPVSFFEGRIEEKDRATATIGLEFQIGDKSFAITRGMFEPSALRRLTITQPKGNVIATVLDGAEMSDTLKHEEYARYLTEAVGLQSFDQFVFLQHFVLTFDESRNLLFWNANALESALFLAFDADPKQQTVAQGFRRDMERAESRGRNYRYDALRVKQRIDSINAVLGKSTPVSKTAAELEANYEALLAERNAALDESLEAEALAADADVQFAGASATLLSLRRDYAQTFSKHVGDRSITARHPIVLEATENLRCGICGSQGDSVAESVRAQLAINACPLCDNPLDNTRGKTANLERLKELDIRIGTAKSQLESTGSKRERLALSLAEVRQRVASCTARVREFEIQHSEAAKRVQGRAAAATAPQDELDRLTREFETLLNESKQAYAERDTWKTKLQAIQKKLEQHYQNAEKDFVPLFRTLAEQFLGIDLDIVVERQGAIGITLVLEMRQTKRRLQYQLSESQRFFLDIALRMALATFVSDKHSKAALFVDTPEGSLDIAYESRAGAMFASFAKSGHDILMTANINTSELLRKLASECGDQRMTLVRMTEWTDLSNVQLQESPLFERAYGEIEKELHTHAE